MIYTLTLNPSIDYVMHLKRFESGTTNRTAGEEYYIGGKGINVSRILAQLDITSTASGFCAGFTGDAIISSLKELGICSDMIRLNEGISRINIKLITESESEINAQGPYIPPQALEELLDRVSAISDGDTIVLAGSIPESAPDDTYERILERLRGKRVRIVIDAEKRLLFGCLSYRPFLIKPNRRELSEIAGRDMVSEDDIASCAGMLMDMGARNVIVSLGGDGAILFAENGKVYHSGTLSESVLSTVGAGDSMVAGFIAGFERTGDYSYAFRLAAACGNATAFSAGLADRAKIDEAFEKIMLT